MSIDDYNLDALVADPDITTRARLKEATSAVAQFASVYQFNTLNEALSYLQGEKRCDVMFISYRYQPGEVKNFLLQAKESPQGRDSAYVMVLKAKDQEGSTVASNVMLGVDGFLFEPYSVDSLVEITRLARRIRAERSAARVKLAITLSLSEVIQQLDVVAFLKSTGVEVSRSMRRLKEMCADMKGVAVEALPAYFEVAVKTFTEILSPRKIFQMKEYSGVSDRVKKRMEEKLRAKAEAAERGQTHTDVRVIKKTQN